MLCISTWLYGNKYSPDYVEKLYASVKRHLKQPFRFLCITERERVVQLSEGIERYGITDPELLQFPGCLVRLRMFDPSWQRGCGITGRLVCIDLDVVVTGALDILFDRAEPLVVLQGANAANPCPYNCSVMLLRAGANPQLWTDFTALPWTKEGLATIPNFAFPDDQGWIHYKVPDAAGWQVGKPSGIYAVGKPGWPKGMTLPKDARIVAFPGWRDPSKFADVLWVKENWADVLWVKENWKV